MHRVLRAQAGLLVKVERPHYEDFFMAADEFDVPESVGTCRHTFILVARKWPRLPALQFVSLPFVHEWVEVVARNHVPFAALDIKRKHNEKDFIPKKAVFE